MTFCPPLEQSEFEEIARIVYEISGIVLDHGKLRMVQARLSKRLRLLKLDSFQTYARKLNTGGWNGERRVLLTLLTTNMTSLFREPHHFKVLKNRILPGILENDRPKSRVRIWSAGCSFGHEAYSIGMVCLDFLKQHPHLDLKILATDIDPTVIQSAKSGIFNAKDFEAVPTPYQTDKYWESKTKERQIAARIRNLVTFRELNLLSDWPFQGSFDIVFCRNVMIYFDEETRQKLLHRFAKQMSDQSWLFVGHSERVTGSAQNQFRSCGQTIYSKTFD